MAPTPLLRHEACIVCGARDFRPVFACTDHLVTHERFGIADCARCGLRVTDPLPSEQEIGRYYESADYVPITNARAGAIARLYHAARFVGLRLKRRMVCEASGRRAGRILDVGCGTGELPGFLARSGWEAVGVEPHAGAREQARRLGIDVHERLPDALERPFDVITLWHVLEHLHDPGGTLERARAALAPDGVLIVACPNHRSRDGEHYGPAWYAYDVPRHLWHFTADTMTRLLARHGLVVRAMRVLPFDPFYIALLSARHGGRGGIPAALAVGLGSLAAGLRDPARATAITYVAAPTPK